MTAVYEHAAAAMGTVVSIMLAGGEPARHADGAARGLAWFSRVEAVCSRFDEDSELRQLCRHVNVPVPVSELLFEALQFACAVAEASDGAFDPTVGAVMETLGFDRHWRTDDRSPSLTAPIATGTWRDVELDPATHTVTLARPLLLDLGGLAKGLAIDLAAKELAEFEHFAIDAGGDLYLSGCNGEGMPWSVGVRDPRLADAFIARLRARNVAVCTSGDYERRTAMGDAHHLVDPRTTTSAADAISATVVASHAMVADALATAAFVLGPARGIALLERHGVEGLIVGADRARAETTGMHRYVDADAAHGA